MSNTSVNAVTGYLPNTSSAAANLAPKTLGQDDFLKLLVAQLTSQDPLNPQSDTNFIAQMAQFSSLEQSKSMQTDMAQMRNSQDVLQANALLGRAVQVQTGQDTLTSGVVSAVQIEAGTPQIVINGRGYPLSQLLSVAPA
jgi:flagellar basal-body rod modification protein FlgD